MSGTLLSYLNDQLVTEYEMIYYYLYYSGRIQNCEIEKAMLEFGRDEFNHVTILVRYIVSLGEQPISKVPKIDQGLNEVDLLTRSITAEESALRQYALIQDMTEEAEYKKLIGEIIVTEEQHRMSLENMLRKLKKTRGTEDSGNSRS